MRILPLLRSLLRRPPDADLDEELRFHIEREIEERVRNGADPDEARRSTLRDFGGVTRYADECRETRPGMAMEQLAQAAAEGLTEGTLQTCLEQQALALGPTQPCPTCGRACPLQRETRPLAVRGGRLDQSEPVCHCPDCRRDFFPPTTGVAPRRPRL